LTGLKVLKLKVAYYGLQVEKLKVTGYCVSITFNIQPSNL